MADSYTFEARSSSYAGRSIGMAQLLDDQATARFDRVLLSSSATDVLIATFCAEEGHELLHNDRDFDFMATCLGLKVADAG